MNDFQGSLADAADMARLRAWFADFRATGAPNVPIKVVAFEDPCHFEVVRGVVRLSPEAAADLMTSAARAGALLPRDFHLRN